MRWNNIPYIKQQDRKKLNVFIDNLVVCLNELGEDKLAGNLNYIISKLLGKLWLKKQRYIRINELTGVLECVKQEFYRRIAVPYEEYKKRIEGDVY